MKTVQQQLNIPPFVFTTIVSYIDYTFPFHNTGANRRLTTYKVLEYCFLVLRSGMPWRSLEYCLKGERVTWHCIYKWFTKWSSRNVFQRAYEQLLKLYTKQRSLRKPILEFFTDTTFIKNVFGVNCVGPSPVDRGRKASKLSVLCDDLGVVHALTFHPGNKNDCRLLRHTLNSTKHVSLNGKLLCADKGYDTNQCRMWVKSKGMIDCILRKQTENVRLTKTSRIIVENVFGWLDTSRRLILRYDKMIQSYKSFTYLALFPIVGRRLQLIYKL